MTNKKGIQHGSLIILTVIFLMVANLGLFYRMNQLQAQVIEVLAPF